MPRERVGDTAEGVQGLCQQVIGGFAHVGSGAAGVAQPSMDSNQPGSSSEECFSSVITHTRRLYWVSMSVF